MPVVLRLYPVPCEALDSLLDRVWAANYDAARPQGWRRALPVSPDPAVLWDGTADLDAVSAFTGLAPRQVPVYVSIANSFASFGDFADAISALDQAIAVAPSDPLLYQQRANVYLQQRDTTHAYADYRHAIKVTRSTAARAALYANLALVYDQQGDFNSAVQAIATAIRLAPTNARYYLKSATIHRDMGSLTAALSLYDHALRLVRTGPDAEAAHEGKGDILVKLGQRRAAIAEYKKALKLASKDDTARLEHKIKAALHG